jgi:hypothetical protein
MDLCLDERSSLTDPGAAASHAGRGHSGNYARRMTSMMTTMSRIRTSTPPPMYTRPPEIIRPCAITLDYLYPPQRPKGITLSAGLFRRAPSVSVIPIVRAGA